MALAVGDGVMQPTLSTARLMLRPIDADDGDAVTTLMRLPDVRRYLCDDTIIAPERVAGWIAESRDPSSLTELWVLTTAARDFVGIAGVRAPTDSLLQFRAIGWRSLELVVALGPSHWGRGYATEAVAALAGHARNNPVTFALVACVDAPNENSHRLMHRSGFFELGRMPGPIHQMIVYELAL